MECKLLVGLVVADEFNGWCIKNAQLVVLRLLVVVLLDGGAGCCKMVNITLRSSSTHVAQSIRTLPT